MLSHAFQPHPTFTQRDQCEHKFDDEGRVGFCGRPRSEHQAPDPGLTSEQRAAIAVHHAERNRVCLDPLDDGSVCLACADVADQIDAAVEVERQRGLATEEGFAAARLTIAEMVGEKIALESALAREKARADAAEGNAAGWQTLFEQCRESEALHREALAAARRECEGLRDAIRSLLDSAGFDWDGGAEVDASVEEAVTKARAALAGQDSK